jgi:hypothetical protein
LSQDTDSDWAIEEFGAADLGDARRAARLVTLARQLGRSPHCSFPQSLSPAQLKAAYRFFDNDSVDTDGILSAHIGQTLGRMGDLPVALAVQDSTEYNLTHLPATQGVGMAVTSMCAGSLCIACSHSRRKACPWACWG